MPSLSDDVATQISGKLPGAVKKGLQAGPQVAKDVKEGIVLIFNAPKFSIELLMKAVKMYLNMRSPGVQYSPRNVSMKELQKSGQVSALNEELAEEVMKPLDKVFRKAGIKYKALFNKKTHEYLLLFSAKDTAVIDACLKKVYADWQKKQNSAIQQKEKGGSLKKVSVRSKLAFFRRRAKKYNENREKMNNLSNEKAVDREVSKV